MSVKLVAITKGVGDLDGKMAEELVSFVARVSNPSNQNNFETAPKLLGYLIRNQHWSPFEHAYMTLEIETSRAIAAQILRHRSFVFQEFCISGDSKITCGFYNEKNKFVPFYIPIKKLYERQGWGNYKNILVRVYDEATKSFTVSKIKEVFNTGVKPCFKITFEDGKSIISTKEHKFLTREGFVTLEKALGITLNLSGLATMSSPQELAVNGDPCHQNKDWLSDAKIRHLVSKTGVPGIAEEAGVSYHTIRKWLKIHNLRFSKKETASMKDVWNKGKTGYELPKRSEEFKLALRAKTPKGKHHHSYRGGAASERKAIANFFEPIRKDIFKNFNYTCQLCFKSFGDVRGRIELHHIKEVGMYPELAREVSNVIPVHRKCHMEHHGKSYYFKSYKKGKGNTLVPRFTKVIKIEYVGEIETYDMEVEHGSHNYVANKIVVHNSQRYAEATEFTLNEPRRQDVKNRQNSIDDLPAEDVDWFLNAAIGVHTTADALYKEALRRGIAKECARFLLPLSTKTRLYMTGSARSWLHYIELRSANGTQLEHMDLANEAKKIFAEQFPATAKAAGWVE